MRCICSRLARGALVSTGLATLIGFLAPWWPVADLPNHFTPLALAVAVAGLALLPFCTRELPRRHSRIVLGVGLGGMVAVNSVPLLASQSTAAVAAQGATRTLTVVSYNIFGSTRYIDRAARWLRDQDADVIVLQEMTRATREPMRVALAATHLHVHDCNCNDIVIYSRRPWLVAGGQSRTGERPALSWLTLADAEGTETRIIGVHTRINLVPYTYAAQFDWLVEHIPKLGGRVIVAGDFNAAPWSWQMTRLATSGLRRHGTYEVSWPSLLPMVLTDNLLTTPDIKSVSFRTGPFLGSDHLPIIAIVALP
jgi:endonuclease/exonuclease/phosphatase (EEP) superfamily protein YafD